jgi:hypothetical protein
MMYVNGTGLFFAEEGTGQACVLLHGGPGLDHSAALSSWWGVHQMPLYDVRPMPQMEESARYIRVVRDFLA